MAIEFKRKGRTAKDWYSYGPAYAFGFAPDRSLNVALDLASKGGGVTEVMIQADAESFREIALAMIVADREAAISAFGEALQWKPRHLRTKTN